MDKMRSNFVYSLSLTRSTLLILTIVVVFLQICNRVTALDWRQILVFTQCLENELT